MLNIHNAVVILSLFYLPCFVKIFSNVKWHWDSELVLVIFTSKKAFWPSRQNRLARASSFALRPVWPYMISPSNGCNRGSISTSLQISVSNWASKSLTLLGQIVINPLVLQFNACAMLKDCLTDIKMEVLSNPFRIASLLHHGTPFYWVRNYIPLNGLQRASLMHHGPLCQ